MDTALIFTDYDHSLYQGIRLKEQDRLGLLMRKDSPLAEKDVITRADLRAIPLIVPRASQLLLTSDPAMENVHIAAVYNLIYNASVLVEDGVGYAIGFDGLINVSGDSPLTFRPLDFTSAQNGVIIWKKYQVFSPAVNLFINSLKEGIAAG